MTATRRRLYYGYPLALLAFFLSFIAGAVHLYSRGIFVSDQIRDFGASRTGISLTFSAVMAAAALFAPVLGSLLDRYPIRRVMAIGAVWLGVGFLLLSQVSSLLQFAVLSSLFVGIGTSAIGTSSSTALMVNWFDRHRGLALAVAITGYSVAGIVMAPASVQMLESLGWRRSYLVFGTVSLFIALPLILWFVRNRETSSPEAPQDVARTTKAEPWRRAFGRIAADAQFWQATLIFGVMSGVFVGLNVHLFLYLTDQGIDAQHAAWVLSVEGFLAIIGKPLFGWLADRYGTRGTLLLAVALSVIATAMLPGVGSFGSALVVGGLLGVAFGSIIPLQATVVSRMYGGDMYARANGAIRLTTFPLSVTCPLLFGVTFDRVGSYEPAFFIVAGALALTLPAALRLRPPLEKRRSLAATPAPAP